MLSSAAVLTCLWGSWLQRDGRGLGSASVFLTCPTKSQANSCVFTFVLAGRRAPRPSAETPVLLGDPFLSDWTHRQPKSYRWATPSPGQCGAMGQTHLGEVEAEGRSVTFRQLFLHCDRAQWARMTCGVCRG